MSFREIIYKVFRLHDRAIYVYNLPNHRPFIVFERKELKENYNIEHWCYHYRFAMKHKFLGFEWFSYPSKLYSTKDFIDFDIKSISSNNITDNNKDIEFLGVYPFKK